MEIVLAIDCGGTSTRLMIQTLDGEELARHVLATRPYHYDLAMREIVETARSLTQGHRLMAGGAGIAGVVSEGVLNGSGNLHDWIGHNIQTQLEDTLDAPVAILNDAQAAGLGEYTALGRSFAYVIWGTGVGATLVLNEGSRVAAVSTEMGHLIIDRNSRLKCGCGGYGHLEALVGGTNIPNRRFGLRRGLKPEQLNDRQWNAVLADMAVGLRSISAVALGLPIVLGGGVAIKQASRLPVLQSLVSQLPSSSQVPTLLLAKHGEDSGLLGAAVAAKQLTRV